MDNRYSENQQPISWGEIADIQRRVDAELDKGILTATQLMGLVDSGFLLPEATPTERDVALGYLHSIAQGEE